MNKIESIVVTLFYKDEEGVSQSVHKNAQTFESATENLGKLERWFQKQQALSTGMQFTGIDGLSGEEEALALRSINQQTN